MKSLFLASFVLTLASSQAHALCFNQVIESCQNSNGESVEIHHAMCGLLPAAKATNYALVNKTQTIELKDVEQGENGKPSVYTGLGFRLVVSTGVAMTAQGMPASLIINGETQEVYCGAAQ